MLDLYSNLCLYYTVKLRQVQVYIMDTRHWLDVADDLEEETVKDKLKSKIQHREKTHNKKEWKGIKKDLEKKNNKKTWNKKRRKSKNVKKTSQFRTITIYIRL